MPQCTQPSQENFNQMLQLVLYFMQQPMNRVRCSATHPHQDATPPIIYTWAVEIAAVKASTCTSFLQYEMQSWTHALCTTGWVSVQWCPGLVQRVQQHMTGLQVWFQINIHKRTLCYWLLKPSVYSDIQREKERPREEREERNKE